MRHYEIVVLVSAEQHERGSAMAERYQQMVSDSGGAVHRFEDWGSRRLAYPIGKRSRARYFLFNVECDADTLGKLKEDFRYSESVIRSLVIRREKAIVDDSPILTEMKENTAEEDAVADSATPAAEEGDAPPAPDADDKENDDETKK